MKITLIVAGCLVVGVAIGIGAAFAWFAYTFWDAFCR